MTAEPASKVEGRLTAVLLLSVSAAEAKKPAMFFESEGRNIKGHEIGKTHDGRSAVLTAEGEIIWAPWGVCPTQVPPTAVEALRSGKCFRPSRAMTQRLDKLLSFCVTGKKMAQDFANALSSYGECFVVGGAVRDVIGERPGAIRDLDFATTLTPHLLLAGLAPAVVAAYAAHPM